MGDPRETRTPRVVILGAGVNGCCVARELALNGVSTWVIDANDIGFGASSKSSRLIHGGLRYLEFGEFSLVRESLIERERLTRLAPQFVKPLRLHIPVQRRTTGMIAAGLKFLSQGRPGFFQKLAKKAQSPRGLWVVRLGLWFYDRFAASRNFPSHTVQRIGTGNSPRLNEKRFRWTCSYSDAQMGGTERFVMALLHDARMAADANGVDFRVLTHRRLQFQNGELLLRTGSSWPSRQTTALPEVQNATPEVHLRPEILVNATGAWGDLTLQGLNIASPRLFGGTRGSHFVTWNPRLVESLRGDAVYAEADDGRLIFVIPWGASVLVGTTDERFEDDPGAAIATEEEIEYLISSVNDLFPEVELHQNDVAMHYSGVRPLPWSDGSTAAISRDHSVEEQSVGTTTLLTLVGGKLTTCRAFGEIVADKVLQRLDVPRRATTDDRPIPGGECYPENETAIREYRLRLAKEFEIEADQAEAVFQLFGTLAQNVLMKVFGTGECQEGDRTSIQGTFYPRGVVRWIIQNEWVRSLGDLVERRLMLVFQENLRIDTLRDLAKSLQEFGTMLTDPEAEVSGMSVRLQRFYGIKLS